MDLEEEERIILSLTLRARGGDVDAAKLLFMEKARRVRPVRFQQCQTLDELKDEFERYMGMADITRAESDHASRAFDRLFRLIKARDEANKTVLADVANRSGMLLVPVIDPNSWNYIAENSQSLLKSFART